MSSFQRSGTGGWLRSMSTLSSTTVRNATKSGPWSTVKFVTGSFALSTELATCLQSASVAGRVLASMGEGPGNHDTHVQNHRCAFQIRRILLNVRFEYADNLKIYVLETKHI